MSESDAPSNNDAPDATIAPTSIGRRSRKSGGILPVGFVLNGIYEVKRLLARGGMGEVYEGVNVNADERVAIKVILPHLAADPKVQALFRKEAKTLIGLAHPALVQYRVLAREPRKDLLYIVTDFIDGEPLTNLIGRGIPTASELVMLTRRLAQGLGAAHHHGAIHRDISPDNVLLPGGVLSLAKIIDFGIAKSTDIGAQTVVGDGFAGKLGYVAPEQFGDFGRNIGPWTDIYSLGLVALALGGGAAPDMGTTLVEAIDRRRSGPTLTVLPEVLQPLFARMLSPNPVDRPQSMDEVIAALAALDVPDEPPSFLTTTEPARFQAEHGGQVQDDAPRTVIGSAPGASSWGSIPPASTPPVSPSSSSWGPASTDAAPAAEPPAPVDEAPRTVFSPGPSAAEAAAPAEAVSTDPPAAAPAEEAPRTIFSPGPNVADAAPEPPPTAPPPPLPEPAPPPEPVAKAKPKPEPKAKPAPAPKPVAAKPPPGPPPADAPAKKKSPVPMIAAAGLALAVLIGGGVSMMNAGKSRTPAAAPAAAGGATASATSGAPAVQTAIAAALPGVSCSWLSTLQGGAGGSLIRVVGAASDPDAVNKAVSGAAQGAGAAGVQVDTGDVLPAPPALCPLLDTVRTYRGGNAALPAPITTPQTQFEMSHGIQGCPTGLFAQSVVTLATDPSKAFTLVLFEPSGRVLQMAADRDQFAKLAAKSPDQVKDLGAGRYRVSTCHSEQGLAGAILIQGTAPFDLGVRPGGIVRPPADFAKHLGDLAKTHGWTMDLALYKLVDNQPDLPGAATAPATTVAAATPAGANQTAQATPPPAPAAPPPAPPAPAPTQTAAAAAGDAKIPADWVPCRKFVNGGWEEAGYANQAMCIARIFTGHCEVQTGQSGALSLRRYNGYIQGKSNKLFGGWNDISPAEQCAK